jgi:xanthine dehydrogenase YagS FAD-binding subunit
MNPFHYERVTEADQAVHAISPGSKFLAGGTNLIDLMKNSVEKPEVLIDINRVALAEIEPLPNGGLRLGALARNSDTANHPAVRRSYPLLSQAILSGASPQLRNQATNGRKSYAEDSLPILHGHSVSSVQQTGSWHRLWRP